MESEKPQMTEEQRKEALEKALARVKHKVETNNGLSVQDRLKNFANRPDEHTPKGKDIDKDKPMSLEELSGALTKNAEESQKIGLLSKDGLEHQKEALKEKEKEKERTPFEKDDKKIDGKDGKDEKDSKEDEKDKDKEKDPVAKQEQKMKEMFSKVQLPSGMEIHQEGPQWVLVSKDGKQRTDVTDVMNTIDKYNRDVDTANEENKMQNEAQSSVDKAADVNKKEEDISMGKQDDRVATVSEALPEVKYANGDQVFKPEDIEEVAKTALSASDEKAMLAKLNDTKALEEMQERDRKNNKRADEKQQQSNIQQMQSKSKER